MWICLNNAFFSIVEDESNSSRLLVRARREGDIERVFGFSPDPVVVEHTPERDYPYRASLRRSVVMCMVFLQMQEIDYPNFKASVREEELHNAYEDVWLTLLQLNK